MKTLLRLIRARTLQAILFSLVVLIPLSLVQADKAEGNLSSTEADRDLVILIHGMGRSNSTMAELAGRLEEAGYEVHRVGYRTVKSKPDEIIEEVTQQINECCIGHSRTVHFVGHSLGGLLIRAYLQDNEINRLGNTVMVGTPNQGTRLADRFKNNRLVEFLVPTALALGTDKQSLPNQLELPYYTVGIIAGTQAYSDNDKYLPGVDDGLVPVESTKLEGMKDFIEISTNHSDMRSNEDVARQIIAFLKTGSFNHE